MQHRISVVSQGDRMDAKGREAQQRTAGVKVSWGDEAREIVGKKQNRPVDQKLWTIPWGLYPAMGI